MCHPGLGSSPQMPHYANHAEAMTDVADDIGGFYNLRDFMPSWETCDPTLLSVNRQINHLSSCPK